MFGFPKGSKQNLKKINAFIQFFRTAKISKHSIKQTKKYRKMHIL